MRVEMCRHVRVTTAAAEAPLGSCDVQQPRLKRRRWEGAGPAQGSLGHTSYLTAACLVRVLCCCCWISSWAASRLSAFLASAFLTLPLLGLLFFTLAGRPPPPPLSTG